MNPIWHESSRASNLYFISGGHKPANAHQWGPGVRDVYALHYIIRGQGTLETGGRVFRLVTGKALSYFRKKRFTIIQTRKIHGSTSGWSLAVRMPGGYWG